MIKLTDVSYKYKKTTGNVLENVTAEFSAGKLYAIIGASGAGKSTVLSLIAGLDFVQKGSILYNNQDVKKINMDKYRAGAVGVIFQSYNLLQNFTALDNVVMALYLSKKPNQTQYNHTAYNLLAAVGIKADKANRNVLQLSGGEQQRVAIARCLAADPAVIIADEPTGNLDEDNSIAIMNILRGIAHTNDKCVIFVTHSKEIADCADEKWKIEKKSLKKIS